MHVSIPYRISGTPGSKSQQQQLQSGSGLSWNDDDIVDARRSSSSNSNALQPPPAHQHGPRNPMSYSKPQLIPGTSSTLTPIDLSSG